mmetsp:Transcript_40629/g.35846  ORF Transcript_40629/g.35846 Transcript_40629/m.35846 type:complete len:350 (+) Transcript_40629:71-1120(+)
MSQTQQQNANDEEIYTFIVEWYDSIADLKRKYRLTYWVEDGSLSMYDLSKHKLFLKRIVNKDIKFPNDLYIGKTVVIYSRQLKIIDYNDLFTKNKFESISKLYHIGFVGFQSFTTFLSSQFNDNSEPFHFKSVKSVKINDTIQRYFNGNINNSNILIFCEFVGSKKIQQTLDKCLNNKQEETSFCGKMFDETNDSELIFEINKNYQTSATLQENESLICLIKPHSLLLTPNIMNDITNEGFRISAITTRKLTLNEAKEFMEVYDGVIKEYNYLIEQLLSGTVIVLQVQCIHDNTFTQFRNFVGPKDPEIAKYIRPNTLRAKYGVDRIKNGVHCTDLKEDGNLESKFFFA